MPSLYVADTNVYVGAANDPVFRDQFETFIREHGPVLVSTVVVAEVLFGIAEPARHPAAVEALSAGSALLSPTADDWVRAGEVTVRLGGAAVAKSRSFWNDTLLSTQCSRLGAALVTHNARDFQRLRRLTGVEVVVPFPCKR